MSHTESNKSQSVWALLPERFQTSLQNYFPLFHLSVRHCCCRCEALPNEAIPMCLSLSLTHLILNERWIHLSLLLLIPFFQSPFPPYFSLSSSTSLIVSPFRSLFIPSSRRDTCIRMRHWWPNHWLIQASSFTFPGQCCMFGELSAYITVCFAWIWVLQKLLVNSLKINICLINVWVIFLGDCIIFYQMV